LLCHFAFLFLPFAFQMNLFSPELSSG